METTFTGVLIKRDYKPGQDYVQLIFKGAKETKLSISRNVTAMKHLTIGGTYKLTGREYKHGAKTYLRDPKTIPVTATKKSHKKLIFASIAGFSALLVAGGALAVYQVKRSSAVLPATTTEQVQIEAESNETLDISASEDSDTQDTNAQANTPTQSTTTRRSSSSRSSSNASSSSTQTGVLGSATGTPSTQTSNNPNTSNSSTSNTTNTNTGAVNEGTGSGTQGDDQQTTDQSSTTTEEGQIL